MINELLEEFQKSRNHIAIVVNRREFHGTPAMLLGSILKDAKSFLGHHISATFELRAGVVKAEARRVERSESLDEARAQLEADHVMADASEYGIRISAESGTLCNEYATDNALAKGAQIAH